MLAINLDGDFTKFQSIRAEKLPWLRSSSILNLFADRKAISVPDAKAEKSNVINMILQSDIYRFTILNKDYKTQKYDKNIMVLNEIIVL